MNKNESEWIEEVLQSMEGSQRAKPDAKLLIKIQEKITNNNPVIYLNQFRKYAVVAVLIVFMNTSILIFLSQKSRNNMNKTEVQASHRDTLITSFQIYDL